MFEECNARLSAVVRHLCGLGVVALISAFDRGVFGAGRSTDIVMTYLLGVVAVAMRLGYGPALLVAASSVVSYNFFFVPPYSRFKVYDVHDAVTFGIMLFVAIVIGKRTESVRRQAESARRQEGRITKLYAMSCELAVAASSSAVIAASLRHVRDAFDARVSVLVPSHKVSLSVFPVLECTYQPDARDVATALRVFVQAESAGLGTPLLASSGARLVPLLAPTGTVGVLGVMPRDPRRFDGAESRELLDTFANQLALAMERGQLAEQAHGAELRIQTEQLRNALLSSVSHDLRTPLAVVQGAATELLERGDDLPVNRRAEYLQTISDEARRLNRLVHNLLDMTALEAGVLQVNREWLPIDEVIGVALGRLEGSLRNRPVEIDIPSTLPLVAIDATLIEQVLINLLDNAIKFAPDKSPICIAVSRVSNNIEMIVADRGSGITPGEESRIFDKFHRANRGQPGMGLGLTICRGIVVAHGGSIGAENRPGGGALFRVLLPLDASAEG
jgi:two-component system, OmpR family, sensor histidine kinase KdpD